MLAKVDASAELAARKDELAVKIAAKLHDSLNTVVPVSAAVERALDGLSAEGDLLDRAFELMRGAPADELEVLLADEQLFCELDELSIPVAARQALRRAARCEWAVFATIVRLAATEVRSGDELRERLAALSGFGRLRETVSRTSSSVRNCCAATASPPTRARL